MISLGLMIHFLGIKTQQSMDEILVCKKKRKRDFKKV